MQSLVDAGFVKRHLRGYTITETGQAELERVWGKQPITRLPLSKGALARMKIAGITSVHDAEEHVNDDRLPKPVRQSDLTTLEEVLVALDVGTW
jgi:DNA-binding PadR family transcriptional regulator